MEAAMRFESSLPSGVRREVLDPTQCRKMVPGLRENIWVYRYAYQAPGESRDWVLSVATLGEPQSRTYSLGGFRIVPKIRAEQIGFSGDKEAIHLAAGMEEKVLWSRLFGVAGPRGLPQLSKIVGGKCVLHPTDDARIGNPRDTELLDFACACLLDIEETAGIFITTGQDLGHGILSDGETSSLAYLHARFPGSIVADTSKPTAVGNYFVLRGMLHAMDISLAQANIGLIGCGNIGRNILGRILEDGAKALVLESSEAVREDLRTHGILTFSPEQKGEFLLQPMDALVVNANGGSLDSATVEKILANSRLRVICGSENLALPNPEDAEKFWQTKRLFCPTELAGMMGYLTAVEEYLCRKNSASFDMKVMLESAKPLEKAAERVGRYVIERQFQLSFEQAVYALYSPKD